MALVGALLSVAVFLVLLDRFGIVEKSTEVVTVARASLADVSNAALSDETKEAALRGHAVRLFALFFQMTAGLACALVGPLGLVWLGGRAGLLSFPAVTDTLMSWDFIVLTTLLIGGVIAGARVIRA